MMRLPGALTAVPMAEMGNCDEGEPMAGVFEDFGSDVQLIATCAQDEDARLFAAAPDLLAALLAIRDRPTSTSQRGPWVDWAKDTAAAAVAKATGL